VPPTPPPTPTPRPTPRPLPTPVPPSQALGPAATTLQTKVSAFRAALRAQDVAGSLRLQRELLAAASDADTAVKGDKSPQAQVVRGAVTQIRAAIAGDTNGLDHADAALRQVIGGGAGGVGVTLTGDSSADPVGDLHTLAMDVRDFRQAVQSKNAGDALRLQGKLVGEVDAVFDVIGGEVLERSTALVRPGGTLVTIAMPPTVQPKEGRAVFFVVEPSRARLADLAQRLREGRLKPIVGAVRPLTETADAFARHRRTLGKTIIQVAKDQEGDRP